MRGSLSDFDFWFDELVDLAYEVSGTIGKLVDRSPFMYEDYHEAGMTPAEALLAEWGE